MFTFTLSVLRLTDDTVFRWDPLQRQSPYKKGYTQFAVPPSLQSPLRRVREK